MKALFTQYFASLKERGELDVVIPDMLSELGLNVFSRPRRGTRQYGVDVAAVGKLGDEAEKKVYLLSIKGGDLDRRSWNSEEVQSLRPSLDEIRDVYLKTRLPDEYRNLPVIICICVGGVITEQIRPNLTGYITDNTTDVITYQEWNGDKLADLLGSSLLREEVVPSDFRGLLRKSLALIDEPEASFLHFQRLVRVICEQPADSTKQAIRVLRQLGVSAFMLLAWAREEDNLESAYLGSEFATLNAWEVLKPFLGKQGSQIHDVVTAYHDLALSYYAASHHLLEVKILPQTQHKDAIASAVRSSHYADVNLKLFDLLGRFSVSALWLQHRLNNLSDDEKYLAPVIEKSLNDVTNGMAGLISNNQALSLPLKDDQAIDIFLAALVLFVTGRHGDLGNWLRAMIKSCNFAIRTCTKSLDEPRP